MRKLYLSIIVVIAFSAGALAQCTVSTTQTDVSCFGANNGTATANPSSGVPPYTYSWAPGGQTTQTATGLAPGTYTVTVMDAGICNVSATVTITEPSAALAVTTSHTDVTCMGGSDGTATAMASGGTPPYSYSWNSTPAQSTSTATGLTAGTYAVAVIDANGCSTAGAVTLTQPTTGISATASVLSNVSCFGSMNGSAMVMATDGTGPLTYMWSSSSSTNDTLTGAGAGIYIATVTDSLGCSDTASVTITQPSALTISSNIGDATCYNECNGYGTVIVTGGTLPYLYSWSNGWITPTDTNLCAGTYTVSVVDSNGCSTSIVFSISEPSQINISTSATNTTCVGCANGTATATATGGAGPYTFLWMPCNQTTATAAGLPANTYTVCVTDSYGCTVCDTVSIADPSGLSEVKSISYMFVTPNPANDALTISLGSVKEMNATVRITDVTGRVISDENISLSTGSTSKIISVDALPAGNYFIFITGDGNTITRRFVKM